jgi:hypothetical protein
MAKNGPKGGGRKGEIKNRKQVLNPKTKRWVEINTKTKKFINVKADKKKFKDVRKGKQKAR